MGPSLWLNPDFKCQLSPSDLLELGRSRRSKL